MAADLDFIKVVGRFGLTVGDGGDADEDPDITWCDSGSITFEPVNTYTKVAGASPIGWTGGQATIDAPLDASGYLTRSGMRRVSVVDLTSAKVNPQVPAGKATHVVRFVGVKAGATTVAFPQVSIRIAPDDPGYGVVATAEEATELGLPIGTPIYDLVKGMPVPTAGGTPIVVGPQGASIKTLSVVGNSLVATLNDASSTQVSTDLPSALTDSDAATASRINASGSATATALDARLAAKAVRWIDPDAFSGTDTAKVQAALDAVGGGQYAAVLFARPFTITSSVTISGKSKFGLVGLGGGGLVRGSGFTGKMLSLTSCSEFSVRGMQFISDSQQAITTTTASASAGATTIPVVSTAGYPAAGTIGFHLPTPGDVFRVTYTGKTATSFTGVTGIIKTVPSGSAVHPLYAAAIYGQAVTNGQISDNIVIGNPNYELEQLISLDSISTYTNDPTYNYKIPTVVSPTRDIEISRNRVISAGSEGIIFRDGCSRITVADNHITGCTGTGITMKGDRSIAARNTVVDCLLGIESNCESDILGQGDRNRIVGNTVIGATQAGVFMWPGDVALRAAGLGPVGCRIEDNDILNCLGNGIFVDQFFDLRVVNNNIDGVAVGSLGSPLSNGSGIYARFGTRLTVAGNTVRNVALHSLHANQSSGGTVKSNRLANPSAGITLFDTCSAFDISNNDVAGAATTSGAKGYLQLHSCSDLSALGNKVKGSEHGVYISGSSNSVVVSGGEIRNVGYRGIFATALGGSYTMTDIDITGVTIRNASQAANGGTAAISVVAASAVVVTGNTIVATAANKPTYGVAFETGGSGVTGSISANNTVVGTTAGAELDASGANQMQAAHNSIGVQVVSLANDGSVVFEVGALGNTSRRGWYCVIADAPGDASATFFSDGATIYPQYTGTAMSVASGATSTTFPNVANKFNVFLTGNRVTVTNKFGSARTVRVIPLTPQSS